MIERNATDNFSNDDYVRIVNFNYFINEHFNNTIEWLLGTGILMSILLMALIC